MSNEWGFGWDGDAARGAGEVPEAATMPASLPPQKARHRRSNSTPLENTSSELLTAASDTRAEEQDDYADGSSRNLLQDVLNGPTLTKTRSERVRSRGGSRGIRRGAMPSAARQNAGLAQRVSGRMTKGRSKMTTMREGYSTDEDEDSGDDAYLHGHGRGGKVKRVLANRQSAQRSRIRKLQHISELEVTLEALQHDLFKLNPQLTKLEAKQAGLDDENKELQQKLAALKVESRQKEAVNQTLAQELSDCRHSQQTQQLAYQQQQQQRQGNMGHFSHAPPQAQAQASALYQQQPFGSPQSSYAQPLPMYPPIHSQAQQAQQAQQAPQQPAAAQADGGYDHDFVDRLMERCQYDQAQARQRQQQAAHVAQLARQRQQQQHSFQQSHQQHEQQQQQHKQQQRSGRSVQDRSRQQSHGSLDMLPELGQPSSQVRPSYQDPDEAHAPAHWGARQEEHQLAAQFARQEHSPRVSRHGSCDSLKGQSSPQLIYSNGFPAGDVQYMLSHQQQEGLTQFGQHSLDAEQSQWASHNRTSLRQSTDGAHAVTQSGGSSRMMSQPQRHSFDGPYFQEQPPRQAADQQQLLYRSQSLMHPPQQAAVHDCLLQQQQSMYQSADGTSLGAGHAQRHLQRHSTGQTHLDALPFMPQHLQSHFPQSDSQRHMQSPLAWPYNSAQAQAQSWSQAQSQPQSQPQSQYPVNAQSSPWEAEERLFQAGLQKKKSSGDMSRHGSGSTEGPLSEYVPAESILRSFDSVSNASSEQSERSLGATQRAALGGLLRAEGHNALVHGPAESVRHAAWAKGMPPSGKKKKDNSQHRAALSRLT